MHERETSKSSERPRLSDITAEIFEIREKQMPFPQISEGYKKRVGGFSHSLPQNYTERLGKVVIRDGGEIRGVATILAQDTLSYDPHRAQTVICGGGPLTSAIYNEAEIFAPFIPKREHVGFLPQSSQLVENFDTLLTHADLLYFDPMGTGFNRQPSESKRYFDMQRDIDVFVASTLTYMDKYKHPSTPLMIVASSFGSFRAIGAALELTRRGRPVSEIALLAPHLDYSLDNNRDDIKELLEQNGIGDSKDSRSFAALLPVLALANRRLNVTEKIREKRPAELYKEAGEFASGEYAEAFPNIDTLSSEKRQSLIDKLSYYTGLSPEIIDVHDLKITMDTYRKLRLEQSGEALSMLNATYHYPSSEKFYVDPLIDIPGEIYSEMAAQRWNSFFRGEQQLATNYVPVYKAFLDWTFTGELWENRSVHQALITLRKENPNIKLRIYSGIYDMISPPGRARYIIDEVNQQMTQPFTIEEPDFEHAYTPVPTPQPDTDIILYKLASGHALGQQARETLGVNLREFAQQAHDRAASNITQRINQLEADGGNVEETSFLKRFRRGQALEQVRTNRGITRDVVSYVIHRPRDYVQQAEEGRISFTAEELRTALALFDERLTEAKQYQEIKEQRIQQVRELIHGKSDDEKLGGFGEKLGEIRRAAVLSIEELGSLVNEDPNLIYKIEKNTRSLSVSDMKVFLDVLAALQTEQYEAIAVLQNDLLTLK